MAFPRDLLRAVGGFHEALGRRGHSLLSMEEVLVREQLKSAGHTCLYEPRALVHHRIPAERLARSWFIRRTFWNGVSTARVQHARQPRSRWRRWRRAGRTAAGLAVRPGAWAGLAAGGRDPERFTHACRAVGRLGYALGLIGPQLQTRSRGGLSTED